jgi:hypothetical protein
MPMTRATKHIVWIVCCLLCLASSCIANADTCNSASGTSCSVTCSVGTLSLSCSKDAKACSGSCSDNRGALEVYLGNIARDIYLASESQVEKEAIFAFFRKDLDSYVHERTAKPVQIGKYRFDLHLASPEYMPWRFVGDEFNKAVDRVEKVFMKSTDEKIKGGDFLLVLREAK